jgi:hypothetical protein
MLLIEKEEGEVTADPSDGSVCDRKTICPTTIS